MVIMRGDGRGDIGKENSLKVVSPRDRESPWVKVIAMHESNKQGIGILQNTLFNNILRWGELVLFKEFKVTELPRIVRQVFGVPDSKDWRTVF